MRDTICIDAGPVIHLVAFPEDEIVKQSWEKWELQDLSIIAPTLLYYEVTNVLFRYQRYGVLSKHTANSALSAALALPIQLFEDPELHIRAIEIADEYNLNAAYDAHYLALAERYEAELWTTDEKFFRRIQAPGKFKVALLLDGK